MRCAAALRAGFMDAIFDRITRFIEILGKAGSLLILPIMAGVTYEVLARYAFNAPTNWSWVINRQLFGVFVLIAGSYTLIKRSHIHIEILFNKFPPVMKMVVRWLTLAAALIFLGSLLWNSALMGFDAWQAGETATGVLKLPLYPMKMFMPVATFLFILACVVVYTRKRD